MSLLMRKGVLALCISRGAFTDPSNELPHDKTNKMACAPSEYSVWSVFSVLMKKAWVLSYPLSAQCRLIRLVAQSFCWFSHEVAQMHVWKMKMYGTRSLAQLCLISYRPIVCANRERQWWDCTLELLLFAIRPFFFFFFITWFTDFFLKKIGSEFEKKQKTDYQFFFFLIYKTIESEEKKRPRHQEEISVFLIDYQYFFFFFSFWQGCTSEGKKKTRTKKIFFLKMAKIRVGGIRKPRNKKKCLSTLFTWTRSDLKILNPIGHLKCICLLCFHYFRKTGSPAHNFWLVKYFRPDFSFYLSKLTNKNDPHMSRLMTKPTKWQCAQRRRGTAWAAPSLISLRCPHGGCPGWAVSSLGTNAILLVLSWGGWCGVS